MRPVFDVLIHAPTRLRITAALAAVDGADFSAIRDSLGVSDSALSKHVKPLSEAGYVNVTKTVIDSHVRTSLALTSKGRKAYRGHIESLRELTAMGEAEASPVGNDDAL
ncbi:ArsR family transcriptional regulator [Cryobacterium algoricola]|uniref:ArsR family transcriptional regulator n=1 Tax=Cryobacterium algoricola TaxID=1259183 RepID=A0ABY2IBK8_9MICO|nr:transcriptional regulator [Cryobacterium algoricola]TFB85243.1 ArsR family transcriptional regulator [Cryobacterium algoricola]